MRNEKVTVFFLCKSPWGQAEAYQDVLGSLILFCCSSYGGLVWVRSVSVPAQWACMGLVSCPCQWPLHWPLECTETIVVSLAPSVPLPVPISCIVLCTQTQALWGRGCSFTWCLYSAGCQCLDILLSPTSIAAMKVGRGMTREALAWHKPEKMARGKGMMDSEERSSHPIPCELLLWAVMSSV